MARDFLRIVRETWISRRESSLPEIPPPRAMNSPEVRVEPTPAAAPTALVEALLAPLPLAMLIAGGLLTIFTELVGTWAILGYLLVTLAPVVYWLQRIERRLAENRARPRDR